MKDRLRRLKAPACLSSKSRVSRRTSTLTILRASMALGMSAKHSSRAFTAKLYHTSSTLSSAMLSTGSEDRSPRWRNEKRQDTGVLGTMSRPRQVAAQLRICKVRQSKLSTYGCRLMSRESEYGLQAKTKGGALSMTMGLGLGKSWCAGSLED